jgi:hypothetical protein
MKQKIELILFSVCLIAIQACNINLSPSYPTYPPSQTGGSEVVTGVDTYTDVSVSPDGTKLAFLRNNALFICDTSGKDVILLSAQSTIVAEPKWSPNGKEIGFVQSNGQFEVIEVASRTINSKSISDNFASVNGYSYFWNWSPDSQKIGIVCYAPSGGMVLKIFKTDGSGALLNSYPVANGPSQIFYWSPDGSQIVLVATLNESRGVYIATIGQPTINLIVPDSTASNVSWFPNSYDISYMSSTVFHLFNILSKQDSIIWGISTGYEISPNGQYIGCVSGPYGTNPNDNYAQYSLNSYELQNNQWSSLISANQSVVYSWAPSSREIFYNFNGSIYKVFNSM